MCHDLKECGFQSPVELFYKLFIKLLRLVRWQAFILGLVVCEINFLGITHKDYKIALFFQRSRLVSPKFPRPQGSETETLAIRDQDQGSEIRDLQQMVLRPRQKLRPGLKTTTLCGTGMCPSGNPVFHILSVLIPSNVYFLQCKNNLYMLKKLSKTLIMTIINPNFLRFMNSSTYQ